jgi:transcriptional regulator with XRE-family HTH domain
MTDEEHVERGLAMVVDHLLTDAQRKNVGIVRLRKREGLTHAEIGERIGVSHERARQRFNSGVSLLLRISKGEITQASIDVRVPPARIADDTQLRDTSLRGNVRVLNALARAGIRTVGEARRFLRSFNRPNVHRFGAQGMALLSSEVGVRAEVQAKNLTPKAQRVMVRRVSHPVPGGPQFERVFVKGKDASGRLVLEPAPFEDIDA